MTTKITIIKIFISCASVLLYTPMVTAGSYQSHKSIYQTARTFIRNHVVSQHGQRPEITISKLDSRLRLKKCNKKLHAFLPKGSHDVGKTTVGIKCTGKHPWSLHVPVTISLYEKVLVASKQLQKGSVLTASDIKLAKHNLANLSYGYFDDLQNAIGMKLKRHISAGAVLIPSMLKKPTLISRGQNVTIMARSRSMMVRVKGKALSNGAIGDRIKVMNIKTRKKLEGIIMLTGEVKVEI